MRLDAPINLTNYLITLAPNLFLKGSSLDFISNFIDVVSRRILFSSFLNYVHINCQFKIFIDLVSIDFFVTVYRFVSVYSFLSYTYATRVLLKATFPKNQIIGSITSLFMNAGWYERESYDLFGVYYYGNLDLRRILNDYNFVGFPLRKDFPLVGFTELHYDFSIRSIKYEPVSLIQEFRFFRTISPWSYFL